MAWYLDVDPRKIQFFKAQLWVCSSHDFSDGQHLFPIAKLAWRFINEFHHGITNTNPLPNQKTIPKTNPKPNPKTKQP